MYFTFFVSHVDIPYSNVKDISYFNPLNAELNPICHLLAFLGAHRILHVSWIRVKDMPTPFELWPEDGCIKKPKHVANMIFKFSFNYTYFI